MKLRVTRVMLLMALPLSLCIISCQKQIKGDVEGGGVTPPGPPSAVELRFKGLFDRLADFTLDSNYHYFDDPSDFHTYSALRFTALKYYISNMKFVNTDGDTVKIPDTYFLIDHSRPELTKAAFMIPGGSYMSMSFMLGVDSVKCLFGPRTGALDPALGMFWNPVDGYVNGMIVGLKGPTDTNLPPSIPFSFRVGGYRSPYSTLSTRNFKLGGVVLANPSRKVVINFTADAIQWFRGNKAPFNTMPIIDAPGAEAQKLAQNYYKMFTFTTVQYE